jgi:hypothetical protein
MVTKSPSTGPNPDYVYELWTAPTDTDLTMAFASLLITRPGSKYDAQMSTPLYVDNITKFYSSFVSYRNLPPKKIGK